MEVGEHGLKYKEEGAIPPLLFLGDYQRVLVSDLNTAKTTGYAWCDENTENKPIETSAALLLIYNVAGRTFQIFIEYGASSIYCRSGIANFTHWKSVNLT